jgi:hypothetical protein
MSIDFGDRCRLDSSNRVSLDLCDLAPLRETITHF